MSLSLSVYPYFSVFLSLCWSQISLSFYLFAFLSIHLSVFLSIRWSVCFSVRGSVCLSVLFLSICLSGFLSICLSVYTYVRSLSVFFCSSVFLFLPFGFPKKTANCVTLFSIRACFTGLTLSARSTDTA
jgi:hypothetical protein